MKIFKVMIVAVMAMVGFSSCEKQDDHNHSADLVGTWTCFGPNFAEALKISADGSVVSTGVEDGEAWENVNGNIVIENNQITMTFEDNDNNVGHFDIIPGEAFSVINSEGERHTYRYCTNDYSGIVLGMWVCTQNGSGKSEDMIIQTYQSDGTFIFTGKHPFSGEYVLNGKSTYTVVGDMLIRTIPQESAAASETALACKLTYSPNALSYGDILTEQRYTPEGDKLVQTSAAYLRVKQELNLAGEKYKYNKVYVTNVKGLDKEIDFMGYEFNFAKLDADKLDKMIRSILFNIEFPDAKTIKYSCQYISSAATVVEAPIAVDGNKMTIKVSEVYPGFKDVDFYVFQDSDITQLHIYMPTYSFVNFFANMQYLFMWQMGMFDATDAEAVEEVFKRVNDSVESINVSFIMTSATKSL